MYIRQQLIVRHFLEMRLQKFDQKSGVFEDDNDCLYRGKMRDDELHRITAGLY